ncbi:TPA: hypothetical protein ACH3X1_013956 [Trebouxia sp. C0004]
MSPGTQHSFLGLASSIEGAVMVMHTKHHPLDAVVHWLLGMTMLTAASFVFLEIKAPHSLLMSDSRWAEDDMASSMMAPAVFAMLLLAVAAFQLILYLVMETLYKRFSHGKFTYASLPVLHPPKALQPSSKLDAAMLSQHDIDSRDDSAPEHPDTVIDQQKPTGGMMGVRAQTGPEVKQAATAQPPSTLQRVYLHLRVSSLRLSGVSWQH